MVDTQMNGMSLETFMERYSSEAPFEIWDGEVVQMNPQAMRSSHIGFQLARKLADHADEHELGTVFVETAFVLANDDMNWLKGARVPDVMFIQDGRLKAIPQEDDDWDAKPLPIVPDLAVEVISPTDRYSDVMKKARRYLADGVRLVWLIDPQTSVITVLQANSDQLISLDTEKTLSGGDVITGFALPVKHVFKKAF